MQKKKNYIDETINKKMLILIIIIYLMFIYMFIIILLEKALAASLAFGILIILMIICLICAYIKKRIFVKKRNLIIQTGTKVSGKIINTKITYRRDMNHEYSPVKEVSFVVTYNYNNKQEKFTTPIVAFNEKSLIDKEVEVYISKQGIYVDNFHLKEENKKYIALK